MNTVQRFQNVISISLVLFSVVIGFGLSPKLAFATDTVTAAVYMDIDFDGQVDYIRLQFDEMVDSCVFEAGDWSVINPGTLNITSVDGISSGAISGDACDGSYPYIFLHVMTDSNVTGGAVAPEISYTNQGTLGSLSGVTTVSLSSTGTLSVTDFSAPPVFVSTSPTDASTSVDRSTSVSITFSEPMNTSFSEGTEFTISPDPGGISTSWNANNTIVTLTLPSLACAVTYSVATDNTAINASSGTSTQARISGPSSGDFSFTTASSGCSSSTSSEDSVIEQDYEIAFDPMTDMSAGNLYHVSWSSSDNISLVDIWYSIDGTDSYLQIADNESNDGEYAWRVPDDISEVYTLKIEATDLTDVLASDTLTITLTSEDVPSSESSESSETDTSDTNADQDTSNDSGYDGDLQSGNVIKNALDSTLYYVTSDYQRRVFLSEIVYFTWYESFDNVIIVSDEELSQLPLEGLMLPRAETVLAKIQSDPNVYWLETNQEDEFSPVLRLVNSESEASTLFGNSWSDYVIDLSPTVYPYLSFGEPLNLDVDEINVDQLKTRESLNSNE